MPDSLRFIVLRVVERHPIFDVPNNARMFFEGSTGELRIRKEIEAVGEPRVSNPGPTSRKKWSYWGHAGPISSGSTGVPLSSAQEVKTYDTLV